MKIPTILILIISLIVSLDAFCDTIPVTTGTDSITGSLRYAINKAQNGDIITFEKSLNKINLGSEIAFDKSITISGNPNLLIQIDADYTLQRIFEIIGTDAITVNINDLTLYKTQCSYFTGVVSYDANGGIILAHNTNSTVNINSCYFSGYGTQSGCGGYEIYDNLNGQNGGAIAQGGGILNISNCTFAYLYSSTMAYWGVMGYKFSNRILI